MWLQLTRVGANVQVDGKVAVIEGVPELTGAPVKADDLRAGAAMLIAGLTAQARRRLKIFSTLTAVMKKWWKSFPCSVRILCAAITRTPQLKKQCNDVPGLKTAFCNITGACGLEQFLFVCDGIEGRKCPFFF